MTDAELTRLEDVFTVLPDSEAIYQLLVNCRKQTPKPENKAMAKKLDHILRNFPPERRHKLEARAKELMTEQMTLRDMRKARELTQGGKATF